MALGSSSLPDRRRNYLRDDQGGPRTVAANVPAARTRPSLRQRRSNLHRRASTLGKPGLCSGGQRPGRRRLPLKVLIWEDANQTKVSYTAPDEIAARYKLSDDLSTRLTGINALTDAAIAD